MPELGLLVRGLCVQHAGHLPHDLADLVIAGIRFLRSRGIELERCYAYEHFLLPVPQLTATRSERLYAWLVKSLS
jgi:hypothetical protein